METKHTPGPWSATNDTVKGPSGNIVAECMGYSVKATAPEQRAQGGREANAHLIAAAPELLEACRNLSQYVAKGIADGAFKDCVLPKGAEKRLNQAQAAIAKATS